MSNQPIFTSFEQLLTNQHINSEMVKSASNTDATVLSIDNIEMGVPLNSPEGQKIAQEYAQKVAAQKALRTKWLAETKQYVTASTTEWYDEQITELEQKKNFDDKPETEKRLESAKQLLETLKQGIIQGVDIPDKIKSDLHEDFTQAKIGFNERN